MYGDSLAGMPGEGTEETVSKLTLDDVKAFYGKHVKPANGQLIVVSDLPQKQVTKAVDVLTQWQGKGPSLDLTIANAEHKTGVIYLVNKDQAAQSAIRIGKRAIKRDITGEFYKSYLMNFPLGGAFNSRINLNLREDKGYTYGARSYFWGDKLSGGYTASAEVRADATDKSIVEFVKEIKAYHQNGITDEELAFMRKAINQRDALKYETPSAKLGFLAQILEHDLSPDFVKERNKIVSTISKEEINALAKKHLDLNDMLMVVVGDAKTLRPQLEALNYKVIDYKL